MLSNIGLSGLFLLVALASGSAADTRPGVFGFWANRFTTIYAEAGLTFLRGYMDLQYDGLAIDVASGQASMTNVRFWPRIDGRSCQGHIDRVSWQSSGWSTVDELRIEVELVGLSFQPSCLPPDLEPVLASPDADRVTVDRAQMRVLYSFPGSGLQASLHADATDIAVLDAQATFTYVAFEASGAGDPAPVAYLESASLALRNRGGWERAKGLLPAEMLRPDTVGLVARTMITSMLQDPASGDGTEPDAAPELSGPELSEAGQALADTASAEAQRFVVAGDRIAIELRPVGGEARLDAALFEAPVDREEILLRLNPVFVARPSAAFPEIAAATLRTATQAPETLDAAERFDAGKALVTGNGAPKNTARGRALLEPLAASGDAEAALLLAHDAEGRDPERAYRFALAGGAGGDAAAGGILDRIEAQLDMDAILRLQEAGLGATGGGPGLPGALPDEAFATLAAVRAQALERLAGNGQTRSYALAWFWATLGQAAEDPGSTSLLGEIEAKMAARGPEAVAAFAEATAPLADRALDIWIDRDLASRFGR